MPGSRESPQNGGRRWLKSSIARVEVCFDGARVLVRDTKLGEMLVIDCSVEGTWILKDHSGRTVLTFTLSEWTAFIAGITVDKIDELDEIDSPAFISGLVCIVTLTLAVMSASQGPDSVAVGAAIVSGLSGSFHISWRLRNR